MKVGAAMPSLDICSWYDRRSSGVAVSGERPRKAAKFLTLRTWHCCDLRQSPRMHMSSIIRWRSGVVFSSFMGASCVTMGKAPIVNPEASAT